MRLQRRGEEKSHNLFMMDSESKICSTCPDFHKFKFYFKFIKEIVDHDERRDKKP